MAQLHIPEWIESDELILRPFTLDDADQVYYALFSDPAVTEFLPIPTHPNVDFTRLYLNACIASWEGRGPNRTWGMFAKADGKLCASIELNIFLPRVEFGVAISQRPGYRRRRAGLTMLKKLIDWLMAQPEVYRLYACCDPEGKAAVTMEKLGFAFETRLANWEPRPNRNLSAADALVFVKTKAPIQRTAVTEATESVVTPIAM